MRSHNQSHTFEATASSALTNVGPPDELVGMSGKPASPPGSAPARPLGDGLTLDLTGSGGAGTVGGGRPTPRATPRPSPRVGSTYAPPPPVFFFAASFFFFATSFLLQPPNLVALFYPFLRLDLLQYPAER